MKLPKIQTVILTEALAKWRNPASVYERIRSRSLGSLRSLEMTKRLIATAGLLLASFAGVLFFSVPTSIYAQTSYDSSEWFMAGANPERTSWVANTPENQTEIPGQLYPGWYVKIEPYIPPFMQIVASNNTLYLSTARGLYAFDATTGQQKWVFPTELPLGNSPTVVNGVAYVGGYDRKIHAIDIGMGQEIWSFTAGDLQTQEIGGGFSTNPLIIGDKLFAGNRDGYMYAIFISGPNTGTLAWKYKTGGLVLYSAAASFDNSTIYFASDDSYAYALNMNNGSLVWKSQKLPGAGFHQWWPVVYRDKVIFSGSRNIRAKVSPGTEAGYGLSVIFPDDPTRPEGDPISPLSIQPGDWTAGTVTLDASLITNFHTAQPDKKTYIILDASDGIERLTAPVVWSGTSSGNRYPPMVGGDDVVYQQNMYMYNRWGQISGWKMGSDSISVVSSDKGTVDEPEAYSGGGNIIYWDMMNDWAFGSFDVSKPNTRFATSNPKPGSPDPSREWIHYDNHGLGSWILDWPFDYRMSVETNPTHFTYGGDNGTYGRHGSPNAPIPYKGKVYVHRGNTLVAFSSDQTTVTALPEAKIQPGTPVHPGITKEAVKSKLIDEVIKMLDAGHLKPGYVNSGSPNGGLSQNNDELADYWHHPFDTFYTLVRALPHLPVDFHGRDIHSEVKSYLQNEMALYPPHQYNHIGWADGVSRDDYKVPAEINSAMANFQKQQEVFGFVEKDSLGNDSTVWKFNPQAFYALWLYARAMNMNQTEAKQLFDDATGWDGRFLMSSINRNLPDEILVKLPYAHNAYIAGYIGYLELQKMAGYQESADIRLKLDHLFALKTTDFTLESPYANEPSLSRKWRRALNASGNYISMVPELAESMHANSVNKVDTDIALRNSLTPYWFVSKYDVTTNEGATEILYDYHSLFQAKAQILKEPYEELVKYLDVPAVARGDLFYIDNLVSLLEAPSTGVTVSPTPNGSGSPTPTSTPGDTDGDTDVDIFDYNAVITDFGKTGSPGFSAADFDGDGDVDIFDYNVVISNFGR